MRARFFTAQPRAKQVQEWSEPAPVQGMDGTVPLHNMPASVAIFLYNIIPAEYGAQTRKGTRVWAQNLEGGDVLSILPFVGQVGDTSTSRLFASTATGIYDITAFGTDNPTKVVTFPSTVNDSGVGSSLHFTDPSGNQVLLVADGENGKYEYNPIGSTWTKYTTEITGVDPTKVAYITIHKGRIWMIERDSADAWYLPVGAKNGAATKFQFGSKMRNGGYLVALLNWSIDGGAGIDDYLLAVSKGGDILAYQGSDPAVAANWDLVGNWNIGPPPEGRRIGYQIGGDTVLLSTYGLTSAAALLQGIDPTRVERNVTGKVARLVRSAVKAKTSLRGWQVRPLPEEGILLINTPVQTGERHIQFALNLNRVSEDSGGGWGMWRDVPACCFEPYNGNVFFGAPGGIVYQMRGSLDNVGINGAGGTPVNFSLLSRYSLLGAPGIFKQVQFIRPRFVSDSAVEASCRALYDYNLVEVVNPPSIPPVAGGALWDTAQWDQDLWSGLAEVSILCGGAGYGVSAAVSIQGRAFAQATMLSIEGTFEPWEFL